MRRLLATALLTLTGLSVITAQRLGYPAEEFTARRQALAKAIGSGTVLLAGRTLPLHGIRFRQDNDFFYLTGNEDTNAVLAIDAPSGDSWLFLPPQSASEVRSDGKNWLTMGDQAKPRGFTAIAPITDLGEFLARRRAGGAGRPLYTRLSERDEVDDSRGEQGVGLARRLSNPLGARPSDDAWRVEVLRQHFPAVELKDVTPAIDQLRVIKSPREIEILTLNGRLSAEAIRKAIEITRPGAVRVPARSRGYLSPLQERRPGQRVPRHRRHRAQRQRVALPGQRAADEGRRPGRDGLRRIARLPGDRHHAHVAGLGPFRRAAAARVPVCARDAEGHHRGDAPWRDARRDARDQQAHLREVGVCRPAARAGRPLRRHERPRRRRLRGAVPCRGW